MTLRLIIFNGQELPEQIIEVDKCARRKDGKFNGPMQYVFDQVLRSAFTTLGAKKFSLHILKAED